MNSVRHALNPAVMPMRRVAAYLPREMIVDLVVSRHRAAFVQRRVMPSRMACAFVQQDATTIDEVGQQVTPLRSRPW